MVMHIGLQQFRVPGPVGHVDLDTELGDTRRRRVERLGEFPFKAVSGAPAGDTDIKDFARVVGQLINAEMPRNPRQILRVEITPRFVEAYRHAALPLRYR